MEINITLALIIFIGVLALIGALKGLSRGIGRQTVRTVTVIGAAVISFFITKGFNSAVADFFKGKTTADVLALLTESGVIAAGQDLSLIECIDLKVIELLLALPMATVIMPIIFVASFIVTSALLLIVHWILSAIFGFKKRRNNALTRLLGMALGLIQGAAVAGLILMPAVGISTSVSESASIIKEQSHGETAGALVDSYDVYVKDIVEDPTVTVLSKCGVNLLYKSIATVEVGGEVRDMTSLMPEIANILVKYTALEGADLTDLTPSNEAAISALIDALEESDYLSEIIAGAIRSVAIAYSSSDAITLPLEPPIDSFVDSAITIFETTDTTNLYTDLDTISEVFFILSRDGVLKAFNSGSDALLNILTVRDANGDTTINRIRAAVDKNERIKPIITLMTKLSVSVMANQMGMDESTANAYEGIKDGINDKVLKVNKDDYATEEEYVGALEDALRETLNENNIQLDKDIVNGMAQYVADNYSDAESLSDDEMNDILLSYYDAYIDNMAK